MIAIRRAPKRSIANPMKGEKITPNIEATSIPELICARLHPNSCSMGASITPVE